jgi:UDP-hydrolysing UDP-N-acetyl-D-glucosamine 2-epimerase
MPPEKPRQRRICFVTGTRAEFGLMRTVLEAIAAHPRLELQIVVTGMHLDRQRGYTLAQVRGQGWPISGIVPWPAREGQASTAAATGAAMSRLARVFQRLGSEVILVVGDRVEAFAAAAAAHLSGRVVAHVHGGDRALGQVDDTLRHAITKLSHVHFAATPQSARRIARLGEQPWRIHTVGAPGIDGIRSQAAPWPKVRKLLPMLHKRRYALIVLHPVSADESIERRRVRLVRDAALARGFEHVVLIAPNNDPGAGGILGLWRQRGGPRLIFIPDLPRPLFLGVLRDAAVLLGNSSAGIIEAASFGTPAVNVGPRQAGRERSGNVTDVPYHAASLRRAMRRVWNRGDPRRFLGRNVYGGTGTGRRIAALLARLSITDRLRGKLIAY